jgi:hypothetical protein
VTASPPALTLQCPWGHAIINLGKDVENRTWPTKHRGPLVIHQGKGVDWDSGLTAACLMPWKWEDLRKTPKGVILGLVDVVDCHESSASGCCDSKWAMGGLWHWVLADPRPLREPIPARGSLGLWRPEPAVLDAIREAS